MISILKLTILSIAFIITGGAIFSKFFRKKKILALFAGFFALISAFFLIQDIDQHLSHIFNRKSNKESNSNNNYFLDIFKSPNNKLTNDNYIKNFSVFKDCDYCPDLIKIPQGKFLIGSSWDKKYHLKQEEYNKFISIKSFSIGVSEVTVEQYEEFIKDTNYNYTSSGCSSIKRERYHESYYNNNLMNKIFGYPKEKYLIAIHYKDKANWMNHGEKKTKNHPVVCVSWDDAKEYTTWLSSKTKKEYRLPSESEWEYVSKYNSNGLYPWGNKENEACRYANILDIEFLKAIGFNKCYGINHGIDFMVPDVNIKKNSSFILQYGSFESGYYSGTKLPRYHLLQKAYDCNDKFYKTAEINSFKSNSIGVYDLIGNASEWTNDDWSMNHIKTPVNGENKRFIFSSSKVIKGGSWLNGVRFSKSSSRIPAHHGTKTDDIGFRVARVLREPVNNDYSDRTNKGD